MQTKTAEVMEIIERLQNKSAVELQRIRAFAEGVRASAQNQKDEEVEEKEKEGRESSSRLAR